MKSLKKSNRYISNAVDSSEIPKNTLKKLVSNLEFIQALN